MIVYPALDLRGGQVVRLQQGDPNRQTVYGQPAEVGAKWIGMGAQWLHVVNLDGTFSMANDNEAHVRALCKLGVPVQFGGGLRSAEDIARAFDLGVARVVLGTIAVQQPEQVAAWVQHYGAEKISVALDARDGFVATHGWQQTSAVTPTDLGKQFAAQGVKHALYTDVSRDGELVGVNVAGTADLARATHLNVIASGGVGSLQDVIALRETGSVAGVILGKALYEGRIDLPAALREAGNKSI
jgi:phosphoribosylformimino-5-aminoimidazole carboxamide ribotide isomerase